MREYSQPREPSPPRSPDPPRRTTIVREYNQPREPSPPRSPDPPRRTYGSPLRDSRRKELSPSRERFSRYEIFQRSRDFLPASETRRAQLQAYPSFLEQGYRSDLMRRAGPRPRMVLSPSNYRFSSPNRQMTERDLYNLQHQRYSRFNDSKELSSPRQQVNKRVLHFQKPQRYSLYDDKREARYRFSSPRRPMDRRDLYDSETSTVSDDESRWRYRSRPAPRYGSPVRRSRDSGRRY